MAKDYTKTLGEFDKKLVTLPKAKSAAKKAADSIKTNTVKKTDKALGKDAKMLPKSKSEKKLPKASKVLESVKKSFLGSSYVDSNGKTARDNYDANPYTQEKQDKFWQGLATEKGLSGTFGRAYTGIGKGFVDATTSLPSFIASKATGKDIDLKKSMGLELPKSADALQNTTAFKVGEVGGNLLGYGAQNIAAAPAIDAILAKTKLGQMAANAGTKLANTGAGRLAGEEAAKNFTTGMARNAVEAGTVGLAQNVGMAAQDGLTGTDFAKDVALNTGIDLVGGSVLEALPLTWNTAKGAKRTASDWLNERNAKKVLETATPQVDEVIDSAKKVDVNQSVKATEVDNATTTLPKKSKKNLRKTENPNRTVRDKLQRNAGKVTVIKNPYEGLTPKQIKSNSRIVPEITRKTVDDVSYLTDHVEKSELKKMLKEKFGEARTVDVDGMTYNGKKYSVNINKKTVGKIVSSKFSNENIALLDVIDDVVKNGEYVGSGKYIQHGNTNKKTVRFDYFETPIKIDGKDYIAKFDVEVFPDVNNYKAHDVVHDIKKIDLVPESGAVVGPEPTAADSKSSLEDIISNNTSEVKLRKPERKLKTELPKSHNGKELKPGGADVLKADMSVEEIAQRYGTFKGSKVPKATDMGDVSQSANTLYYAEMMDDKAREALLDGVKAGDYWKTTVKNKTVIDEAKEAIGSDLEGTLGSFLSVSKSGKQATSRDIAKGYALAEEYINKGDYATVENILADVGMMESEAGRTLQAMRIFNSQTPAGRVKSALKSVQKIESDRGVKIKVNQKLLDDIMNATSDAEKLAANKAFAVDVWNQVPATLGEKLNAWRYLSMLGNPKTHIRNILGNAIFYPFRAISDGIATGLEKALGKKVSKLGGNKSKAWVGFVGNDRELRKLAKSEFKSHRTAMEAASPKYIDSLRPQEARLYKTKPLEGLRRANSAALEKEDQIFMGMSFESAFSQYCKANGKKASEVTGKFRDEAIAYAQRRALEATYRDPNALASAINKLKRKTTISKLDSTPIKFGKKAAEITMESVLPFTKTPANILKRGVEYSPTGILGGAAKIATAKDAETLMKGIEYFASGLTGTGVMIAGYWLGKSGIVNGGMGEYDKVKAYNQMLGDQDYSINIGDKTFTIDWMAPMSMPFFVGVEVAGAEGEDRDMWETIEAMSTITDPLFEMSMLSGIDNVFDTAFSEGSPIVNVGKNAIQNYVSQYVPTLSGQIARTITKDRKTTLSTANSDLEKWANKGLDKLTNKVPGLTELNQPYIDQWGRRDSKQNVSDYAWSAVENMLSPGYISERNETSVDKELKRLTTQLDEEDAKGIVPAVSSSAYKVKYEGKEYSMTESEFTKYKETVGQYRYNALHELFSTKEYKQASAADKRKMIMNVYEEGTELGKEKYLVGTRKTTKEKYDYSKLSDSQKEKVDESGISATKMRLAVKAIRKSDAGNGKAIEKAYALDGFSDDVKSAYGLSDRSINSAKEMKRLDIEYNDFEETANKIDANQNGGYTVDELTSYLNSTNKYTRQQKAAIFDALKSNPKTKNPYR